MILLAELAEMTLTFAEVAKILVILGTMWGGYKIIMEIIDKITQRHDREQSWDKAVHDIEVDREALKKEFNDRLDDQDAKNQQLLSMLCMCLRAQDAILEALVENGIGNGDIRNMHKELKDFILEQVQ